MKGLIEEGSEAIDEIEEARCWIARLSSRPKKVEHYRDRRLWVYVHAGRKYGFMKAKKLLAKISSSRKNRRMALTQIAMTVNREAVAQAAE